MNGLTRFLLSLSTPGSVNVPPRGFPGAMIFPESISGRKISKSIDKTRDDSSIPGCQSGVLRMDDLNALNLVAVPDPMYVFVCGYPHI